MSVRLGCVADDYTGASDLANTLTKCGQRTLQTIGIPASGFSVPDADAVVVSLKIRSIAPAGVPMVCRVRCPHLVRVLARSDAPV